MIFLFIGCNQNNSSFQESSGVLPTNTADSIPGIHSDIVLPDSIQPADTLKIIYPAYIDMKYHRLGDWQSLIYEKFGLDINVIYEYRTPEDIQTEEIFDNTIIYLNFTQGYPYEFNTDVKKFSDDAISHDLSPYYLKYKWDDFVDSGYIEYLKTNEKIFAVPAPSDKYILPRHYNKEYLMELNLEIPTNITDFYSYLSLTKQLNSYDDSFYPMCVPGHYLTQSTADIFRAFGVFFNSTDNLTITYNPNTGSFEDGVFSTGIESALEYIRDLQYKDLLLICGVTYGNSSDGTPNVMFNNDYSKINKKFSTEYGAIYVPEKQGFIREGTGGLNQTNYESVPGYSLTGINSNNIYEVNSNLAFYIFPKTNRNINETIELFNTIFTQSDYYANFKYGIDEIDFTVIDDAIVAIPPSTGAFLDLKSINPLGSQSFISQNTAIINNLSNNQWFEKNVFTMYRTYLDPEDNLNAHSQQALVNMLFNKSLSPYDSIDEYKRVFKTVGLEKIIDNLNEKLGVATEYNYND